LDFRTYQFFRVVRGTPCSHGISRHRQSRGAGEKLAFGGGITQYAI
jgi:hypothetical protein